MTTIPYQTTNWENIPATLHLGETGEAQWHTLKFGDLRMRKVILSKNYKADHWCTKGHITYCLEGEFVSELSDGTVHRLSAGMSYQVSDGQSVHRSTSTNGATMLILDGDFLSQQKPIVNPWRM